MYSVLFAVPREMVKRSVLLLVEIYWLSLSSGNHIMLSHFLSCYKMFSSLALPHSRFSLLLKYAYCSGTHLGINFRKCHWRILDFVVMSIRDREGNFGKMF